MVWNQTTFSDPNPATAPDPADSAKICGAGRVFPRPRSLPPFPGLGRSGGWRPRSTSDSRPVARIARAA